MEITQILADEATVLVWDNVAARKVLKGGNPGHAAVMLRTEKLPLVANRRDAEARARARRLAELQAEVEKHRKGMDPLVDQIKRTVDAALVPSLDSDDWTKAAVDDALSKVAEKYGKDPIGRAMKGREDDALSVIAELYGADTELMGAIMSSVEEYMELAADLQSDIERLQRQAVGVKPLLEEAEATYQKMKEENDNADLFRFFYLAPEQAEAYSYISWWPQDTMGGGTPKEEIRQMRRPRAPAAHGSYKVDMLSELGDRARARLQAGSARRAGQVEVDGDWGKEPDRVYHIPAMGPANRHWGVNLTAMWTWFEGFQAGPARYAMIDGKRSCAGVVIQALKAGGAEAFVPSPGDSIFAMPNEVAGWADRLWMAISDFNRDSHRWELSVITQLKNLGGYKAQRVNFAGARMGNAMTFDELWKPNEWLGQSIETGRVRSGEVKTIDLALTPYHTLDFKTDYARKFGLLVKIYRACMSYTNRYGAARRNFSLVALGNQCLNVMRGSARNV